MSVKVTLQLASAEPSAPSAEQLLRWAQAALGPALGPTAITIRVADEAEVQALNKGWRQIDAPTNALSFPLSGGAGAPPGLAGDVVACAPVIKREAAAQGKTIAAHWAHVIIHGVLHLMGYDHVKERDAVAMEAKEIAILKNLGFPDPYALNEQRQTSVG